MILSVSFLLLNLISQFYIALGRNDDVPETTFTNFHVSDYLEAFDSETDYIGLMIEGVKFENKWYHDGRIHNNISHGLQIIYYRLQVSIELRI